MDPSSDVQALVKQLLAGKTPEEGRALLEGLLSGQVSSMFETLHAEQAPVLHPTPADVRGFRVRLDLLGAKPPIWRRLDLPGDLTLPQVHDAIQAAMGWTDSHLHRFRTGKDARSPYFVTTFDIEEGEDGVLEDDVRLDQLLATVGDGLWYDYDFGDGWDHVLMVEKVLDDPPATARCLAGKMACPPEDCGGIGGYEDLATWVRGGYDEALLPDVFGTAAYAHEWLPMDWHPDHFDLDETNEALTTALSAPAAVTGELAELLATFAQSGNGQLREVLKRPLSHAPTGVTDDEAARLTETYRLFLEAVGDGVSLTSAGYLPPALVERFAVDSGIAGWWIGKANREDLTPPVAAVRDTARALGLVSVRKGRLTPTTAGARASKDPQRLLQHIVSRLPLGTKDYERQSGWLALTLAGGGTPAEEWRETISDLLFGLGWRASRESYSPPTAQSPTLAVLETLASATRTGWRLTGVDLALAASSRLAIRPSD